MHSPYATAATDRLYTALFCDDQQLMLPPARGSLSAWQRALTGGPDFAGAFRRLVDDESSDVRVRALACRELLRQGHAVATPKLLGVVVEVPLDSGPDTLAAYADGSVRFIHGNSRMTMVEGPNRGLQPVVQRLLDGGTDGGRLHRPDPPAAPAGAAAQRAHELHRERRPPFRRRPDAGVDGWRHGRTGAARCRRPAQRGQVIGGRAA